MFWRRLRWRWALGRSLKAKMYVPFWKLKLESLSVFSYLTVYIIGHYQVAWQAGLHPPSDAGRDQRGPADWLEELARSWARRRPREKAWMASNDWYLSLVGINLITIAADWPVFICRCLYSPRMCSYRWSWRVWGLVLSMSWISLWYLRPCKERSRSYKPGSARLWLSFWGHPRHWLAGEWAVTFLFRRATGLIL